MTKSEYMRNLQEKLQQFNTALQAEIIEDYEQHFAEAMAAGKTEDEIIEELGDIDDMLQAFSDEDYRRDLTVPAADEDEDACPDLTAAAPTSIADDRSGAAAADEANSSPEPPSVQDTRSLTETGRSALYKAVILKGLFADIVVEESDDQQLHLSYDNQSEELQQLYEFYQYEEDGCFYAGIRARDSHEQSGARYMKFVNRSLLAFRTSISVSEDMTMTLQIPRGIPELQAQTGSGDISLSRLHMESIQLSSGSGDLLLRAITADQLALSSASGDIQLQSTAATRQLKLSTASGDMKLTDCQADALHIQSGSGEVRSRQFRGRTCTLRTGSGNISLTDADTGTYSLKTGSGNISLRALNRADSIQLQTGSGDVELDLTGLTVGYQLRTKTGSGDTNITGSTSMSGMKSGTMTYGDGACQVHTHTGSGDIYIKGI